MSLHLSFRLADWNKLHIPKPHSTTYLCCYPSINLMVAKLWRVNFKQSSRSHPVSSHPTFFLWLPANPDAPVFFFNHFLKSFYEIMKSVVKWTDSSSFIAFLWAYLHYHWNQVTVWFAVEVCVCKAACWRPQGVCRSYREQSRGWTHKPEERPSATHPRQRTWISNAVDKVLAAAASSDR